MKPILFNKYKIPWYLPNQNRPFAYTTRKTQRNIETLSSLTVSQAHANTSDTDAEVILSTYYTAGYGNVLLWTLLELSCLNKP